MSPAVCPLPRNEKAQFVSFVVEGEMIVECDVRKLQRDIPHLFLKRPRLADHLQVPGLFFGSFGLGKTPVEILLERAAGLNRRLQPCRTGLRQYAARFCAGDHADGGRDFPISGKSLCVIAVHMRGYDVANRLLCNLASNLRDQGKHSRRRGVSVDNQQVFFIFEDRGVAVDERPAARHRGIDPSACFSMSNKVGSGSFDWARARAATNAARSRSDALAHAAPNILERNPRRE